MNLKKILFQGYPSAPHILIVCWTEKIRIFCLIHCLNLIIGVNHHVIQTNVYLCIHCRFHMTPSCWFVFQRLCTRNNQVRHYDLKKIMLIVTLCASGKKKSSRLSLLWMGIDQDPEVLPNFTDFLRTEGEMLHIRVQCVYTV